MHFSAQTRMHTRTEKASARMWEPSAFIKNTTGDPLTISACLHLASFHSCCMFSDRVARVVNVMLYNELLVESQNKAHLTWTVAFAVETSCLLRVVLENWQSFFFSLSALSALSTAKRKFADSLNEFKFQCIGDAETDDEMCIGEPADMKSLIQYNLCWLNALK